MKHISYVLKDEYDHLLNQKKDLEKEYKMQSKRKREACEQGAETRHDNADYEDAEYQQNILNKRISDINSVIQNSKILLMETIDNKEIRIGSTVELLINNKEYKYTIGGHPTLPGRISYMSPLGNILLKQKSGTSIKFIHDKIKKDITILSIT